jgi:hypothetical protein
MTRKIQVTKMDEILEMASTYSTQDMAHKTCALVEVGSWDEEALSTQDQTARRNAA